MILLIDNYDSFAHNLARYFRQLGQDVKVIRNDEWTIEQVIHFAPRAIVISPGPCTPNEAGVCLDVVKRLGDSKPVFGVCLGHQVICQAFGGRIVRAKPKHGQASLVSHNQHDLFQGIASPIQVGRYHSLVADAADVPKSLNVIATAETEKDSSLVMAVAHKQLPIVGVQFHPESILTECGYQLIANFLKICNIPVDDARLEMLTRQFTEQVREPARQVIPSHETVTPHGWT